MTFSLRFRRSRSCVRGGGPRAFWDLTPCRFSRDIVEIISRNTNSAGRSLFRAFIAKCFDKSHAFSILPPAVTWVISLRSRNSDFTWFILYRCMWNILFYVLETTERAAIRLYFFVVFVSEAFNCVLFAPEQHFLRGQHNARYYNNSWCAHMCIK